jgi:hypothetical protein
MYSTTSILMGKYVISIFLISFMKLKTSQIFFEVILFQMRNVSGVKSETFLIPDKFGTIPNEPYFAIACTVLIKFGVLICARFNTVL